MCAQALILCHDNLTFFKSKEVRDLYTYCKNRIKNTEFYELVFSEPKSEDDREFDRMLNKYYEDVTLKRLPALEYLQKLIRKGEL